MRGVMIVSGYLRGPHFDAIYDNYRQAARRLNVTLETAYNTDLHPRTDSGSGPRVDGFSGADFVLFLDKDVILARQLELMGVPVFNSARTIALCDHKYHAFLALADTGLNLPETISAPLCYANSVWDESESLIADAEARLGYPMVVKEAYGSQGKQVYLARDRAELIALRRRLFHIPHLFQQYIASSAGTDVRLAVVGDRVVAAMRRYGGDFRANLSLGGRMEPFDPPAAFTDAALRAAKAVGADFAGVDLLFGENGEPVVCEVNSNAYIENLRQCTGVNVAEPMLHYIIERIGDA